VNSRQSLADTANSRQCRVRFTPIQLRVADDCIGSQVVQPGFPPWHVTYVVRNVLKITLARRAKPRRIRHGDYWKYDGAYPKPS
jgi:hypothetical protein